MVIFLLYLYVKIFAIKPLKSYDKEFPKAEQSLLAWHNEVINSEWNSPNELKLHYRNASIINNKRVVFNIHGNTYRLLVDVEYRYKMVFVVWFGTHKEYDKINVEKIVYVKTN